mmetsp:Transcript_100988/g.245561  ORF Transcript_100988/g.245561 Transcript_100988/m.245561 type:complete len:112 (+) Transcript_100988:701-1036(+)
MIPRRKTAPAHRDGQLRMLTLYCPDSPALLQEQSRSRVDPNPSAISIWRPLDEVPGEVRPQGSAEERVCLLYGNKIVVTGPLLDLQGRVFHIDCLNGFIDGGPGIAKSLQS